MVPRFKAVTYQELPEVSFSSYLLVITSIHRGRTTPEVSHIPGTRYEHFKVKLYFLSRIRSISIRVHTSRRYIEAPGEVSITRSARGTYPRSWSPIITGKTYISGRKVITKKSGNSIRHCSVWLTISLVAELPQSSQK